MRSMCWGPRGVTQVRPTSRSTCVTDSRSNLISGPLSSPMVHVVWPLTYTHGPNNTRHTREVILASLLVSLTSVRPIWPHTGSRDWLSRKEPWSAHKVYLAYLAYNLCSGLSGLLQDPGTGCPGTGHSDLSRPIWPHTDHRTGCPEKNRENSLATCATGLQPGRPGSRAMT